jgi:MurE/MurF fusion protein
MRLSLLMRGIDPLGTTGPAEGDVATVCYDSRRCGPGSLFVAIPGLKADGRKFIADALSRGARFVIHEGEFIPPPGVSAIRVRDSRRTLGILGKNFFGDPSAAVCLIGVVGTNGKTTVTYLLESILRTAGHSVGVLGTVNYRYGDTTLPAPNTTPESFDLQRIIREMADHGVTHVAAEVSSHAIALKRVDDCAFDIGIFTNLTQDHLDFHRTMEDYFQAKNRFFQEVLPARGKDRAKAMIINADDSWGRRILKEAARESRRPDGPEGGIRSLAYGLDAPCDITASSFQLSLNGIEATLHLGGDSIRISSPLMGRFNLSNILAAAGAAFALGVPGEAIRDGIAALLHVPGRLEKVSAAGEPAVFVDYAHTDDALRRVLQNLSQFRTGRIITVFGCGGDRDRGKRPLMGEAATAFSDLAIVTCDNPRTEDPLTIIREIEGGIRAPKLAAAADLAQQPGKRGYLVISDRKAAIAAAIALARKDDIVLIAGKGHEDYQIIGSQKFPFDDRIVARQELARGQSLPVFPAGEILKATGGIPLRGGDAWSCRGISTDTRTLAEGNLFVALKGENFDGHDCLARAARKGASGLLISADRFAANSASVPNDLPVIGVPDTLAALGAIAHDWRLRFRIPVVAITGSSGKTTTKEMIAAIASLSRSVLKTEGNLNNLIGLPLTLLRLRKEHDAAVVEMGTNCPGEIARLAAIAAPDIGLITNIGLAHLEGLGSLEAIREEKVALFAVMDGQGTALFNRDDQGIAELAGRWRGKSITFGLKAGADITARQIEAAGPEGMRFFLVMEGGEIPVHLPVPGEHNVVNALAAAAAASALGFESRAIAAGLALFRPVPGRMEIRRLGNGAFLIIDAYNANPASTRGALKTLQGLKGEKKGIAILGDMLELGERAEELHEEIGAVLADTGVDAVFLKGPLSRATAKGAVRRGFPKENIAFFDDPGEVLDPLKSLLGRGDWILIKGSRKLKMEAVAEAVIRAFDLRT